MGLDMYLYVKPKGTGPERYLSDEQFEALDEAAKAAPKSYMDSDVVEVGYWRKQNHIHKWFVDNAQHGVDECQPSDPIHPELLADLYQRCQAVIEDPTKGPELLPSQGGFFFGSTEYDEWYLEGCKETITFLDLVLREHVGKDVYYQSSW